jgi:phytoene dehydrogenase-like protein
MLQPSQRAMTTDKGHSDVLIVGGGMAGLTAAAYLARAGLKVRLCEKEKRTGGLVNSFEHKGFVFDGGIRAMESSGIVLPMLRQLGLEVEFIPSAVSIGIGNDVARISSKDDLIAYRELLEKHFPANKPDIARIMLEVEKVMGYMAVLYGIDNPLFLDLKSNPGYVFRTILPWLLRYTLTMPKVAKLNQPVYKHLSKLTRNRALADVIAQHFFRETPAFFALSYFTLYLDYRYPRGGTGKLAHAMERYILANGGAIDTEIAVTKVEPGRNQAVDSEGRTHRYRKLIWAADLKTLYRSIDLASVSDSRAAARVRARQQELDGKVGGDSVFTVYVTADLDKSYFAEIASAHFFYTPSAAGQSGADLSQLREAAGRGASVFTSDKARVIAWLKKLLALTTYEISIPVLRDSALAPSGKTGLIISLLFDYSLARHIQAMGWFDEFRNLMADGIIEVLDRSIYPGLKAAVIDSFTSTPLTLERIAGNSDGAITGWAFTNDPIPAVSKLPQIAKSVLTPVPDTYQAGQWTFSPSGLPISILTGKLAADRVIKDVG